MAEHSTKRQGPLIWLASRTWPFWVVTGIAAAFASLSALFFWSIEGFQPSDVVPIAFEPVAWQEAKPIGNYRTVRSQMVNDLISRRLLIGMTRWEVEQLLGPPLGDLRAAGVDSDRWNMAYHVGMERAGPWSLDDELFVIQFDAEGRVRECATTVN